MKDRKRARGGGRKPKGDFSGVTSPLSIRMTPEMRAQLESAARESGLSISQEVLRRIQRSFREERVRARDPAMQALCFLIAQLAGEVAGMTDEKGQPMFDWRTDPFFFRAYKLALPKMLDALEPRGEITPPKLMLEAEFEGNPETVDDFKDTYKSPERRADAAVRNIMSNLLNPRFDEAHFDETAPNHKAKAEREYYHFMHARRDLQPRLRAEKP